MDSPVGDKSEPLHHYRTEMALNDFRRLWRKDAATADQIWSVIRRELLRHAAQRPEIRATDRQVLGPALIAMTRSGLTGGIGR